MWLKRARYVPRESRCANINNLLEMMQSFILFLHANVRMMLRSHSHSHFHSVSLSFPHRFQSHSFIFSDSCRHSIMSLECIPQLYWIMAISGDRAENRAHTQHHIVHHMLFSTVCTQQHHPQNLSPWLLIELYNSNALHVETPFAICYTHPNHIKCIPIPMSAVHSFSMFHLTKLIKMRIKKYQMLLKCNLIHVCMTSV